MTPVRMMSHVPLVRIDAPRVEIGGGALVALPFEDYDDMVAGSFTDGRRDYESTSPVFFLSEYEVEVPDDALEGITDRHLADCDRVRDALALAAPGSSIPDPLLSLRILDIASANRHTQTRQGQADQELLFLGAQETFLLSDDALAQASVLLDVVDRCVGELRQAIDVLHDAADLSLTPNEQLTLCTIELEALLLPELTTELKQTFARRLGHLLGGSDTEAIARAVYAARSDAVHGDSAAYAVPGRAQALLAGAVVALEALTRDGSMLEEIRERLDAGPAGSPAPLSEGAPPEGPRILHAPPRGWPPASSSIDLAGGLAISDPEVDEGSVVLFAPLIGLDFDDLPDAVIDAGFPLSWMWPSQLGGLEDPDIRRDWISRDLTVLRPIACLALVAPGDFDAALEPLRLRADLAVTALRLAGIAGFHDPDLLGVYARDGNGFRYRRPAVYRQTAITQRAQMSWPLDDDEVADVTALWALLLEYEAGRRAPEIDHALALFRRAHVSLGLSRATRLELFFASLEAALGRGAADPLALLSERTHVRVPSSFEWYAAHGVATRNALAHGEWEPDNDDDDALWALRHLTWLLGEVLPALLMAWRRRRKARPAKTLVAALRDAQADLDWRAVAAPAHELEPARYSGLDTSILIERGRMAAADDVAAAARWFASAGARGDVRGDYGLGLLARNAGDLDAARTHLRRAAEGGIRDALAELGRLERETGNVDAARRYLGLATEYGDVGAMVSLGILERKAGNLDRARELYRDAWEAGDMNAAYNLGLLEEGAGDLGAALPWFVRAAEAGHVAAMGWAGDLSHHAGDLDAARRFWQLAADNGDEKSASHLAQLL
jgi:TPR repeat protein